MNNNEEKRSTGAHNLILEERMLNNIMKKVQSTLGFALFFMHNLRHY